MGDEMMRDNDSLPHHQQDPRHDGGRLQPDDIRWTLTPDDRHENLNLLLLDNDDVLQYVAELRHDLRTLRALLSASLTMIQHQQGQITRFQRRLAELLGALRLARAEATALRRKIAWLEDRAA
jgi:hypothetical protein